MPTSIDWTDSDGAASLANGVPAPGDRFRGWTPRRNVVGASATGLGTGARHMFAFRTDHVATFTLDEIPMASLDLVLRLMAHLEMGGIVEVITGDVDDATYDNCCLAEGGTVELRQQDAGLLTYSLTMTLVNLDGADMLCDYNT